MKILPQKAINIASIITMAVLMESANAQDAALPALAGTSPTIAAILQRGRLIVGHEPIYRCYDYKNPESGEYEGFVVDLTRMLAVKMFGDVSKLELKFAAGSFDNGNVRLIADKHFVDMEVFGPGNSPFFDYLVKMTDEPYLASDNVLIVRKDSSIKQASDIKAGTRIITDWGTVSKTDPMRAKYPNATWILMEDRMDEFSFLRAGKADALYGHMTMGFHDMTVDPNYRMIHIGLGVRLQRWASPKDDVVFSDYLTKFLREVKGNGEYDRLLHKWFDIGGVEDAVKWRRSPILDAIQKRGRLVVGSTFKFRMFNVKNPTNGKYEGYMVDVAKDCARYLIGDSNAVEWKYIGDGDPFDYLKRGDVDVIIDTIDMGRSGSNTQFASFSNEEVFLSGPALLVKADSTLQTFDEITNDATVIYVKDNEHDLQHIKEFAPKATFTGVDSAIDGFELLKAGKGDALVGEIPYLVDIASRNPGFRLVGRLHSKRFCVISKKGDSIMSATVDDFVRIFHQSNTANVLYTKWFEAYGGLSIR